MERAMEGWGDVQRQGQDLAGRFSVLAQGIGSMLQSHISSPAASCISPETLEASAQQWRVAGSLHGDGGPWHLFQSAKGSARKDRVGGIIGRAHGCEIARSKEPSGIQELGKRLGQAGAELGACIGELVGNMARHFCKAPIGNAATQFSAQASSSSSSSSSTTTTTCTTTTTIVDAKQQGGASSDWTKLKKDAKDQALPGSRLKRKTENGIPPNVSHLEPLSFSNEEFLELLAKSNDRLHKQSSITVTTTYDSRTQDIESSLVARGDFWRAEASHGSTSSASESPLFMLQVGPVLLVRDSTLLLPVHLSKQHLLWYGFDRKTGLHSLCPAIWSKQRKWLLMSMISLNSLRCSFMDLQFPTGQLTYVAGEGFTTNAFVPALGGVFQAQGRLPGEMRLSHSYKNKFGTRFSPSLLFPEKSFSFGVEQPLSWQRSGLVLRPMVHLSVTPTFGGRNAGWRAEMVHLLSEKLSWGCGCFCTLEPRGFASICVGRSKQNGEYTGNSGLVVQVETPLENLRRASMSIQLNSGIEF